MILVAQQPPGAMFRKSDSPSSQYMSPVNITNRPSFITEINMFPNQGRAEIEIRLLRSHHGSQYRPNIPTQQPRCRCRVTPYDPNHLTETHGHLGSTIMFIGDENVIIIIAYGVVR